MNNKTGVRGFLCRKFVYFYTVIYNVFNWLIMKKLKFFRGLITGLCLWCSLGLAAQTIERIDPPNWWTGMKNPGLQLLVYGKNISETNASFTYEGVELKQTQRVESPNYLFLDLNRF